MEGFNLRVNIVSVVENVCYIPFEDNATHHAVESVRWVHIMQRGRSGKLGNSRTCQLADSSARDADYIRCTYLVRPR